MSTYVIVNPRSGSGRTGRKVDRIVQAIRGAIGPVELASTGSPGDGARLAREAVLAGSQFVVAVGGDGTASEVMDGIVGATPSIVTDGADPARRKGPLFGLVPCGTGSDLCRTIGIPRDLDGAVRALAEGGERLCDVGRIELAGHDGTALSRHFVNVAGCGIAGVVVRNVNSGMKLGGGKLSFMLASARALLGWSDQPVRWRVNGGEWNDQRITSLSVCNGRFFGGGMQVAPDALMDDGLFDVVVWSGFGMADFLTKRRMLYDGSHVMLPNTRVVRARTVEAEAPLGTRVLLDVDGEQPGTLPARFTILPRALRVRIG